MYICVHLLLLSALCSVRPHFIKQKNAFVCFCFCFSILLVALFTVNTTIIIKIYVCKLSMLYAISANLMAKCSLIRLSVRPSVRHPRNQMHIKRILSCLRLTRAAFRCTLWNASAVGTSAVSRKMREIGNSIKIKFSHIHMHTYIHN